MNGEATARPGPPSHAATVSGLWNRTFLLIWQGQLVSSLGDVVYEIALGFWILEATGSTALMGSLMAASILPRILVSPFAGVIVDRSDRRRLLIVMDVIRGAAVVSVGLAALAGLLEVWMVFAAGALIGLCGAFFSPCVTAAIPDVVPRDRLIQGNSAFSLIYTGSNMLGNSAGGFLFQLLGAPLLFLFNGVSYLFSAGLLLFAKIPSVTRSLARSPFFGEMRAGFVFGWRNEGLRWIILAASFLNFFATMGVILILPLFQKTEGLGAGRYGVAMACFSGGLFLGFSLGAALKFPPSFRFPLFFACCMAMSACMIAFPLLPLFLVMLPLLLVAGVANALLNTFITVSVQMAVPGEMRGKVFSLMGALSQGLTPLAMALGGVIAEFVPLRPLISACFAITLLLFVPLAFSKSVRVFVSGGAEGPPPT